MNQSPTNESRHCILTGQWEQCTGAQAVAQAENMDSDEGAGAQVRTTHNTIFLGNVLFVCDITTVPNKQTNYNLYLKLDNQLLAPHDIM